MQWNLKTAVKIREALEARWQLRRCTEVGKLVRSMGRVMIRNAGRMRIEDGVIFSAMHLPIELSTFKTGEIVIGEKTYINSGVAIVAQKSVRIGKNCAIGNLSIIMDSDFHSADDHSKWPMAQPVVIEDDVWIAARVTILKGVTIGRGSTVAAGAVVAKDVPPRTLVGGVPARVIRQLDPEPIER